MQIFFTNLFDNIIFFEVSSSENSSFRLNTRLKKKYLLEKPIRNILICKNSYGVEICFDLVEHFSKKTKYIIKHSQFPIYENSDASVKGSTNLLKVFNLNINPTFIFRFDGIR